jgi:signal transduction histidine kinase
VAGRVRLKALVERILLNAAPWRAWLETLGLGAVLLLGVSLVAASITAGDRQNGMFIAILTGVTLYALRLRLPRGSWRRQLVFETVVGLGLALLLAGVLLALGLVLLPGVVHAPDQAGLMAITVGVLGLQPTFVERQAQGDLGPWLTFVVLLSCLIAFGVSRAAARLWLFWNRLRRQRLIWELTHSHLMLVVAGVVLWAGYIFFAYLNYALERRDVTDTPLNMLFGLVPLVIVMLLFVAVALVTVLPPAMILSYFAARRTTRRLQALITATGALRSGEYGARVDVAGEDEVAQLQADFNAMSAALQAAMHDLQTERDAVAALLRSRRELVASVSHELRTPIAIVRSHLEAMLARWESTLPPALQDDVGLIDQQTAHLQRLLDDLFTLSRAEVGELDLRLRPTDVAAVARRCVAVAAPVLWQSSKVELVADAPDALPLALADELRLEQIIHNLLRNAARHTPPGGIVAVSVRAEPDALLLQVQDTGEGIAPQDLPHIWERFYRSSATRARDSSGAGLGLALVKELTQAMHGSVQAASTPGHGSCFTICRPRATP